MASQGGAAGGEDVLVVEVPVEEAVAGVGGDFAQGCRAVLEEGAGLGVRELVEGSWCLVQHSCRDVAEAADARRGRYGGQVGQEVGDDEGGFVGVGVVGQHPGVVEAFQEHGSRGGVVVEEVYRVVAVPDAQGGRFALALVVQELEFEDGVGVVGAEDREDQGCHAVHGPAVDA